MALAALVPTLDRAGRVLRLSMAISATDNRPALIATDPVTGDELYVQNLPNTPLSWNWLLTCVHDQTLLITSLEPGLPPLPVLLNVRVRKALARALKAVDRADGRDCTCRAVRALDELRLYHALALLLFTEGDYGNCQQHLDLLADLEPCACVCAGLSPR